MNLKVGAASSRDYAYYLGLSGTEGVEKKIRSCFFTARESEMVNIVSVSASVFAGATPR